MIEILGLIAVLVYVLVAMFILGFGIGDEMGFRNPEYGMVFVIATFWPFVLLYAITRKLWVKYNE